MRKSTIVLMVIVVVIGVGLTWLLDAYVGYAETELKNGRDLTEAYRAALAPGSRVKLRRVPGGERYPVKEPDRPGLIVEAEPSAERWAKDLSALGLARELTQKAFQAYAVERPISWVLLRMKRPDEKVFHHAFRRGEEGHLEPLPVPPPEER